MEEIHCSTARLINIMHHASNWSRLEPIMLIKLQILFFCSQCFKLLFFHYSSKYRNQYSTGRKTVLLCVQWLTLYVTDSSYFGRPRGSSKSKISRFLLGVHSWNKLHRIVHWSCYLLIPIGRAESPLASFCLYDKFQWRKVRWVWLRNGLVYDCVTFTVG